MISKGLDMVNSDSSENEFYAEDLTWREQDILILLAERLTNREIADRLHLAESTVKDYVGKILSKLYVKNRRQAVSRAKEIGLLESAQPTEISPSVNLPAAPTAFIGRKHELSTIKDLLRKTRLLTITAPGGMGKTRLALQAAKESADLFEDGVFFVSLASTNDVNLIPQTIAEAVKFPLMTQEDPEAQLIRYLQRKQLLLVLDNFEHLIDGVGLISEILKAAGGVNILVTSREKLNLLSEVDIKINGMSFRADSHPIDPDANDALKLFVQSAAKVRPGFAPTSEELGKITNICQLVQGMPLAIELAASWMYILSVDEIEMELSKGLDILAADVRDLPDRHRSIRSVFDYSWSLLEGREREIFLKLSVFRGGFTRGAAQVVTGASLQDIAHLVNKSFLSLDSVTGRLTIHELLAYYSREKLEESSEMSDLILEAHGLYFAEFMEAREYHLKDHRQISAVNEIVLEMDNLRAAWQYWIEKRAASQLRKFFFGFWKVLWIRGWYHAGITLFGQINQSWIDVQADADLITIRAMATANQGFFMCWLGLAEKGYILAKESISILDELDRPDDHVFGLMSLNLASYYLNHLTEEMETADRLVQIARRLDDPWLLAHVLWLSSMAELRNNNISKSKKLVMESIKICKKRQDSLGLASCYTALGHIAVFEEDTETAKDYFYQCLQYSEKIGFYWLASNMVKYLGEIALLENNLDEAQTLFIQSLKVSQDLGMDRDIAYHLLEFASLRVAQNRNQEGIALLSLLMQQPASHHARLWGGLIRDSGKALLDSLKETLPSKDYLAAFQRGEALDLNTVVAGLIDEE